MNEIKPSELNFFKSYLVDLKVSPTEYFERKGLRDRWDVHRDKLTDISARADKFMLHVDSKFAQGVMFYKTRNMSDDDDFHLKHLDFYLKSILLYQQKLEDELLHGGLLEKKIQEMTGFELKTLLLATLKEFQAEGN